MTRTREIHWVNLWNLYRYNVALLCKAIFRRLKKIVAILAFAGILLQTFSQVLIVAQFHANKNYIAKNLCENRDKPMMHCNGKCCLKKKLAKEGKEATTPNSQKSEDATTLFYSFHRIEVRPISPASANGHFFNRNDLRTFSFHSSIFHPPSV